MRIVNIWDETDIRNILAPLVWKQNFPSWISGNLISGPSIVNTNISFQPVGYKNNPPSLDNIEKSWKGIPTKAPVQRIPIQYIYWRSVNKLFIYHIAIFLCQSCFFLLQSISSTFNSYITVSRSLIQASFL